MITNDKDLIIENEKDTHLLTTESFGEATLSPQKFQQPFYDSDTHQVKQIFRLRHDNKKNLIKQQQHDHDHDNFKYSRILIQ